MPKEQNVFDRSCKGLRARLAQIARTRDLPWLEWSARNEHRHIPAIAADIHLSRQRESIIRDFFAGFPGQEEILHYLLRYEDYPLVSLQTLIDMGFLLLCSNKRGPSLVCQAVRAMSHQLVEEAAILYDDIRCSASIIETLSVIACHHDDRETRVAKTALAFMSTDIMWVIELAREPYERQEIISILGETARWVGCDQIVQALTSAGQGLISCEVMDLYQALEDHRWQRKVREDIGDVAVYAQGDKGGALIAAAKAISMFATSPELWSVSDTLRAAAHDMEDTGYVKRIAQHLTRRKIHGKDVGDICNRLRTLMRLEEKAAIDGILDGNHN